MRVVNRSIAIFKTFGPGELAARVMDRIRPPHPMSIRDICGSNAVVVREPEECISALAGALGLAAPAGADIARWEGEWADLADALQVPSRGEYLVEYDVEKKTARSLYLITRWRQPKVILETGIARGASSYAFLSAVNKNGVGEVFSLDVDEAAGELVPPELQLAWQKRVVDPKNPKTSFLSIIKDVPSIDFFFHDSNHREPWMQFEFAAVIPKLSPGAIMGGDDVDMNAAFVEAPLPRAFRVILLDGRKASGFAVSSAT